MCVSIRYNIIIIGWGEEENSRKLIRFLFVYKLVYIHIKSVLYFDRLNISTNSVLVYTKMVMKQSHLLLHIWTNQSPPTAFQTYLAETAHISGAIQLHLQPLPWYVDENHIHALIEYADFHVWFAIFRCMQLLDVSILKISDKIV